MKRKIANPDRKNIMNIMKRKLWEIINYIIIRNKKLFNLVVLLKQNRQRRTENYRTIEKFQNLTTQKDSIVNIYVLLKQLTEDREKQKIMTIIIMCSKPIKRLNTITKQMYLIKYAYLS